MSFARRNLAFSRRNRATSSLNDSPFASPVLPGPVTPSLADLVVLGDPVAVHPHRPGHRLLVVLPPCRHEPIFLPWVSSDPPTRPGRFMAMASMRVGTVRRVVTGRPRGLCSRTPGRVTVRRPRPHRGCRHGRLRFTIP